MAIHHRSITFNRSSVNAEIAGEYNRSVRTVEWHLRAAYGKLGVSARSELAPNV